MVLDATISPRALAGLLRIPTWQVEQRMADGRLRAWSLDGRRHRFGWRMAREVILDELPGELAAAAVEELRRLRRGELREVIGPQPPVFEEAAPAKSDAGASLTDGDLRDLVRAAARETRTARLTQALFNNWAHHNRRLALTAQQIAAELCVTWSALLRDLDLQPPPRRSDGSLSNDEILALLLEAAADPEVQGNLSGGKFTAWAERSQVAVTAATVIGRFGSWNAAKRLAGLDVRQRRPQARSEDDLLELLAEAVVSEPAITAARFQALADSKGWDVNAATYAHAFGSWNAAKERVGGVARPRGFHGHVRHPYRSSRRVTDR